MAAKLFALRRPAHSRIEIMPHRFPLGALGTSGSRRWILIVIMSLFPSSSWSQTPGGAAPSAPNVNPPVVQTHVEAVYPPAALAEKRHADVVLTVTVDVDGHVSAV